MRYQNHPVTTMCPLYLKYQLSKEEPSGKHLIVILCRTSPLRHVPLFTFGRRRGVLGKREPGEKLQGGEDVTAITREKGVVHSFRHVSVHYQNAEKAKPSPPFSECHFSSRQSRERRSPHGDHRE